MRSNTVIDSSVLMRVLTWVVILVLVNGRLCLGCSEQERIALLQLKASINYPNGQSLQSWVDKKESPTDDCCEWLGVECSSTTGRVVKISLNYTRESWNLGGWFLNASNFLPFEELRVLHLPYNSIVGFVANEGFERLSMLSNLEVLDLSGNMFNSSVLSSLTGLSSLKYLNLAGNNLQGSIRIQEFNDLGSLTELDLSNNKIRSIMPIRGSERQTRSSKLEELNLYGNLCNSNIISSLSGLSSIKILNLGNNQIEGPVHIKDLDGLINLEELDMSTNEINSFIFPEGRKRASQLKVLHLNELKFNASNLLESLRQFSSLKILHFQKGDLEGPIFPEDWNNKSNLEELVMDYTTISKTFLHSIVGTNSLKILSMFSCGLNGTLPDQGWCDLKSLEELDLSGNGFEGILPSCLGNLTSLRVLDLSYNQFTGNIASSPLPSLTSLEYLSLSNNNLQVPASFRSFANYSNLKVMLIDSNKLVQDSMSQTWVPRFQLKLFSFSNCRSKELEVEPPNFLFYQNDLRIVDLSHNNFKGFLPSWLLENNTRLKELNLRDNSFVGIFQLPYHPNSGILRIDISNNNVTGQIPTSLSSVFPNLRILNMSRNEFEGTIPSSLGDMKSLWALDLSNNDLSGVIPEHLAIGCLSLIFLKLSNNKLEGQIFPRTMNLWNLECLYLDGNNFSGGIPHTLSNLSLLVLDISDNNLTGKIPKSIGNMSTTAEIVISNNHIQGSIPQEICKLDSLLFLDLSENNLTGSIPSCFNPSNIKHVHLYKNMLTGPMTRAFYKSSSLVTLDLRDNKLSGSIPKWIGTLSMLSILLFRGNQFGGTIPDQLCQLQQLRMLDLSQNNISGPIPGCLSDISFKAADQKSILSTDCIGTSSPNEGSFSYTDRKKLKDIEQYTIAEKYPLLDVTQQVEFTTKRISYTYQGDILSFMSGIDLSCNQLTGDIPPELGNLSEVRALNFSHNNMHGSIPATFSNLGKIESLDLSYNKLSGRIPTQLTELHFLAVFSVAHNNLSGEIPEQKAQFGTFEGNSYGGNPLLCGPPLHISCTKTESPSSMPNYPVDEAEDDGFVDMGVFRVSFAASYVTMLSAIALIFYINPYWRQAWFYLVQEFVISSYYFFVDKFLKIRGLRNM